MITLEELDSHKRGMTEVARNARQVSRDLDALAAGQPTRNAGKDGIAARPRPASARRGGKLFFQTDAARRQAARRPAAGQGRQPDPRRRQVAARAAAAAATWCWCPRTSTCASRRARWACPPRTTRTTRRSTTATCSTPACCRCRPTSGTRHGKTMESWQPGRPHLLPHRRAAGAGAADQPVRLPRGARRRAAVRPRDRDHRQDRGAEDAEGLHPPEERGLGRDGAQPRAELRAQPADGPGVRLHHPDRHRRHRQDADDAGLRPGAGAGRPPLHRDHRHPRHRAGGRGHRLPARHRGREDGPVDGRARRQPRGARARPTAAPANGAAPPPTTWCAARSRSRA